MSVETGLSLYWDDDDDVHHASAVKGKTICGQSTTSMEFSEAPTFDLVDCPDCMAKLGKAMRRMIEEMRGMGGDEDDV